MSNKSRFYNKNCILRWPGGKIAAIYALDPAGPKFTKKELKPPKERLDPTDAKFVQVIHTDKEYIGADFDLGHQDFYPNVS